MKETYKNIRYDKLWSPCGDPFVDAGGFALKFLSKKFPDKDILELIKFVTDIYVDKWDSKINSFFLNSNITQSQFGSAKKKSETLKYFEKLLSEEQSSCKGFCRILGIESYLFPCGRNLSVLTGSSKFANFHHTFESGVMLSKEAIIRYHFLPIASELLLHNVCVICSNKSTTTELYVKDCVMKTLMNIGQNISSGVLKNPSCSYATAIFLFVEKILANYSDSTDIESISLYSFTNFGASPDLTIYTLPFPAFLFYRESQRSCYKVNWNRFVRHHYKCSDYKNLVYDDKSGEYKGTSKKMMVFVKENEYKYWRNTIYDCLLYNKSILGYIRKWSVNNQFDLNLLNVYLINLKKMKKETITKINTIADFIIDNTADVDMKKILTRINGITSASLLRRFILKIVEKNFSIGNEDPIITVKDYTDYLFPDTSSWMELRDVLLIDIYQKLHEKKLKVDVDEDNLFNFEDDEN